jgi:hypothetical protein
MLLIMASITLVVVLALIQPFLNMGKMVKERWGKVKSG